MTGVAATTTCGSAGIWTHIYGGWGGVSVYAGFIEAVPARRD